MKQLKKIDRLLLQIIRKTPKLEKLYFHTQNRNRGPLQCKARNLINVNDLEYICSNEEQHVMHNAFDIR